MPSSSNNIIRGVEVVKGGVRPLDLRYHFNAREDQDIDKEIDDPKENQAESPEVLLNEARAVLQRAEQDARSTIDRATAEAAEIVKKAVEDSRRESLAIKEEARQKGYEEGKKEALAKAAAEATAIRDQARSVLRQAEEIRRQTVVSLEGEIIELAREIARKILYNELMQHPEAVLAVAREAINLMENRDEVVLYVNPAESEIFAGKREELQNLLSPGGVLHIIGDAGIQPGGCVAETQYGRVDASLDARWQALVRALGGEDA